MADVKLTDLTPLAADAAGGDLVEVTDISAPNATRSATVAEIVNKTVMQAAGAMFDTDFAAANSILLATTANTPAALAFAASTILGRGASGNAAALTPAQVRTLLALVVGTNVQAHSAVLDATTASFLTADETKLDAIEAGATADQTGAEIKAAYEGEANAYTDALNTKLGAIEALADVTDEANVTTSFPISDDTALVKEAADNTKRVRIDAVAVGTGLTRVIAMPNADVDLADVHVHGNAAVLDATTASFLTADETKLDGISGTNTGDEVSATETVEGIGEIATQAEVDAGTDTTRWLTPATYFTTGTFTPTLGFATPGDEDIALSTAEGFYSRVGDLVTIYLAIVASTFIHSTASGFIEIGGLPFTSANTAVQFARGTTVWAGITKAGYTHIVAVIGPNTAIINFTGSGLGVPIDDIDADDMPSGGAVVLGITMTYRV